MLIQHLIHSARMRPWRFVGLIVFLIAVAMVVFYVISHDNGPSDPSSSRGILFASSVTSLS
jgi:hypothetical protein